MVPRRRPMPSVRQPRRGDLDRSRNARAAPPRPPDPRRPPRVRPDRRRRRGGRHRHRPGVARRRTDAGPRRLAQPRSASPSRSHRAHRRLHPHELHGHPVPPRAPRQPRRRHARRHQHPTRTDVATHQRLPARVSSPSTSTASATPPTDTPAPTNQRYHTAHHDPRHVIDHPSTLMSAQPIHRAGRTFVRPRRRCRHRG